MAITVRDRHTPHPFGRALRRSMDSGARMVERQDGHAPSEVAAGGLVVWLAVVAAMALGANAPLIARLCARLLHLAV